ncbi:MAG: transglycosylase domain-containing protein, partial [Leptospiraceae bacterium]|nr:transglycosylase domain-containing protein [Leptospiraceae bacterium]
AGLAFLVGIYFIVMAFTVDADDYMPRAQGITANRIVDRNGVLIGELFSRKTGTLKADQIPPRLRDILLFVEDRDFYSHGGISLTSIARAFFANIVNFGYSQGGSTITQQLSRVLMEDFEKSLGRKVREASLAMQLESRMSKDEILAAYMNQVYLGHGAYGMQEASKFYFRKPLAQANFVEDLILACLPSAPSRYSPVRHPDQIEEKMDVVFAEMKKQNFPSPSKEDYEKQKDEVFRSIDRSPSASVFGTRVNVAPFVSEHVRLKIRDLLGGEFMYGKGLTIETTIDASLQKAATEESEAWIDEVGKYHTPVIRKDGKVVPESDPAVLIRQEYQKMGIGPVLLGGPATRLHRPRLQTASIGIHPQTGEVLFMNGGTSFNSGNQLNRSVMMYRQTGSSIKPIVYSAGLETGKINPATALDDSPLFFDGARGADGENYWLPENYTSSYEGLIPARVALAKSRNIPAIRVAKLVGLPRLGEQFRKFFFHTDKEFKERYTENLTVAIGSAEMSPLEMAVAFAAISNNGVMKRPYLIRAIKDADGKVLYNGAGEDEFDLKIPPESKVLPGDVAATLTSMLKDAADYGGVSRGGFSSPDLAGKTGTTNEYRDAWFIGFIPDVAAAIWVGFDSPKYSTNRGTGASLAGPLFGRIIRKTPADLRKDTYHFDPQPVTKTVCAESGQLPGPYCPRTKSEIMPAVAVPTEVCELHKKPEAEPVAPEPEDSDFD